MNNTDWTLAISAIAMLVGVGQFWLAYKADRDRSAPEQKTCTRHKALPIFFRVVSVLYVGLGIWVLFWYSQNASDPPSKSDVMRLVLGLSTAFAGHVAYAAASWVRTLSNRNQLARPEAARHRAKTPRRRSK